MVKNVADSEKKEFRRIKELEENIYSCVAVGDCRNALKGPYSKPIIEISCPNRENGPGFESYFARGRFSIARALLEGKIEPTEELAEIVYHCTLCGSCHEVCNNCVNPDMEINARTNIGEHTDIWEDLRADLVDAGVAPLPRHKEIFEFQKKEHNPYNGKHEDRLNWLSKDSKFLKPGGEYLFFVGCTATYRLNSMSLDFLSVIEKSDVDLTILKDEWCCGSINFRTGVEELGKETAIHNFNLFKDSGIKKIVTNCAGCYRTLKIDYPKRINEWDFEVLHSIELINNIIKEGRLTIKKKLSKKITYHDPCHLGRHVEVYDAPREVIKEICPDNFVELRRNRGNSYCCGAGGGVKSGYPEFALDTSIERIKEAEETGAEILSTTCPFCLENLQEAAEKIKSKIIVLDLLELVKDLI